MMKKGSEETSISMGTLIKALLLYIHFNHVRRRSFMGISLLYTELKGLRERTGRLTPILPALVR